MSASGWRYVCEGCQTKTDDQGEKYDVDKVRRTGSKGSAEVLAKIHRLKTGHKPEVRG